MTTDAAAELHSSLLTETAQLQHTLAHASQFEGSSSGAVYQHTLLSWIAVQGGHSSRK
jgi:hypothetical protein